MKWHSINQTRGSGGRLRNGFLVLLFLVLCFAGVSACEQWTSDGLGADTTGVYSYLETAEAKGSGKVYMGREIALVTEHDPGAAQLERPEREVTEFPNRVVEALNLTSDEVVADIGAGTGYFTFRIQPHVPEGQVFAVDIQPEMLKQVSERAARDSVGNVVTVLGTIRNPNLPADSVDLALIVISYHEFSHPREMMINIFEALRPGGRVVLVEYRGEDPTLPVGPLHRMTEVQARKEMEAVGLVWAETKDVLPQQHLMIFEKPEQE